MRDPMPPQDRDAFAAEYALGLLEGDALEQARELLRRDAEFVRDVTAWEMQLTHLTDDIAPVPPSPALKAAVLAQVAPAKGRLPLLQRLWVWQAAGVAALALLAIVVLTPADTIPTDTGPLYTAEITSLEGDFRVVAVVDKTTNEVFLTRTAGAAPEGRILQVWAHGPGEPAESVGLWPEGDTVRLVLPPNIAAVQGVLTLGVSEEPPGGSVTGSPSGRVFGTVDIPGVTGSDV